MYLLDTCAISDFIWGDPSTINKLNSIQPRYIAISSISVMEITYGLMKKPVVAKKITGVLNQLMDQINIVSFDHADAIAAGKIRQDLEKRGRPIGPYDLLLAGISVARDFVLVTSNMSEFKRVNELQVENWRE